MRIDSTAADGSFEFAHLALPGDYLGVENLVGMQGSLAVRAITPARLVPVMVLDEEQRIRVLTEAFIQGHRRCRELPSLKDMAFLASLTPESVCRVLSSLRQADQLQPRMRRTRVPRSTLPMAAQHTQHSPRPAGLHK